MSLIIKPPENRIILPPGVERPKPKMLPYRPKTGRKPREKDSRRLCRDYDADGVVIVFFTEKEGKGSVGAVASGMNDKTDVIARRIARKITELISGGLENKKAR